MNYYDYAQQISHKFIRNYEESKRILKFLFEKIAHDLSRGKRVRFRGFGSFKKVIRPPRKFRNLITGRIETRPAKKDIEFNPSKKLLQSLKQRKG